MTNTRTFTAGELFARPAAFGDMHIWHDRVAELRRGDPVFYAEVAGFDPFWVLTRYADVFAIERDDQRWLNTTWSVLGSKAQIDGYAASGMPLPASLVHLDGQK